MYMDIIYFLKFKFMYEIVLFIIKKDWCYELKSILKYMFGFIYSSVFFKIFFFLWFWLRFKEKNRESYLGCKLMVWIFLDCKYFIYYKMLWFVLLIYSENVEIWFIR